MFFNSIKKINRVRKEINRLLSKVMWNIFLKIAIKDKNWRSQNFDFLGLKILSLGQFWASPIHNDIMEF